MAALKILMMASSVGIGLTYHFTRLSIALKKRGHDVTVLSGPKEQVKGLLAELEKLKIECFNSTHINYISFPSIYKAKGDIAEVFKIKDIDIIHANGATHALHAYLAIRSLHSNKKPAIVTSIHFIPLQKLKRRVMVAILNRCSDITLPVSDYTKEQLIKFGLNSQKTVTVHNAVDLEFFDEVKKAKADLETDDARKPTIVYVARLVTIKGHEYFLRAAAKVLKTNDAKFYVIGNGPRMEFLKKLTCDLKIQNDVTFTGGIYWPQIYYVLSNIADICVSSSLTENFPFYILECMAAGKPVVATDVGGVSEAVIDGVNGYLVPPKDPESLARAIINLIENPEETREMGFKSRKIVEQRFSIEGMTEKLGEIYNSLRVSRFSG